MLGIRATMFHNDKVMENIEMKTPSQIKLTPFQEGVLHVMMLYERIKRDGDGAQGECVFSSRFFTHLLGVQWQGYHNQMMDGLADYGWITITQPSKRSRFFRLTEVGRVALREHYATASLYAWYV